MSKIIKYLNDYGYDCETTYKVIGDNKQLDELNKLLRKFFNGRNRLETITDEDYSKTIFDLTDFIQNIDSEICPDLGCVADYEFVKTNDNSSVLSFKVFTENLRCDEVFEVITEKFPELRVHYFECNHYRGIYETNDNEGILFGKHMYYDSETEEEFLFNSEFELCSYASKKFGKNINRSIEIYDCIRNYGGNDYFPERIERIAIRGYNEKADEDYYIWD